MGKLLQVVGLLMCGVVMAASAGASDLAKEKRWADQVVDALIDGEAVWLDADGHNFLGIYTEAADGPGVRGALVLHGVGVHPNWDQVIYPLRVGLTGSGWSTLSLQMPILPNDAAESEYAPLFEEVAPRIDAGIAYLRAQGIENVVIVGHSLGAAMASYYLSGAERPVLAFAGVGMTGDFPDPRMDNVVSLKRIRIPVLDLYGSADLERVLRTAAARAESAAGNPGYGQERVEGANHFFDGMNEALVAAVGGWLNVTVPAR